MNHSIVDLDPLSNYDYPAYDSYPITPAVPYQFNVKLENSIYYNNTNENTSNINYILPNNIPQEETSNQEQEINIEQTDKTEDTKPIVNGKKRKNAKNYCSEKINDATFPFYGCSICNISYVALNELDSHVTIHKNRMTSYRLRIRNQIKKKQKKLKLKKIKKEKELELEIKPEDGYIGNEKAVDYNENGSEIVNNSSISGVTDNSSSLTDNDRIKNETNTSRVNVNDENVNQNNETGDKNDETVEKKDDGEVNEEEAKNLEKIYKCFACKKQFTLSYYLKLHVRSHTDEKPYPCSVCGQSFITASKLSRHNKRIHLAERFQCRICFKIFSRFEILTNHFDKHHPEDKLEGEPYDYNAILPYLKELEEQLREQAEAKEQKKDDVWFDCGLDDQNTDIKHETKTEVEIPLEPKNEVLMEEVKLDTYDLDVKIKEEIEELDVEPPGDDFRDDMDYPVDEKLDEKEFKEDSFSDEDYFPSNTWAATPKCDPSPPHSPKPKKSTVKTCEICQKEISSASYMRVHMRTHTGERPFKCYMCGRGFITSSKMNRHVLTHESDGKEKIENENGEVKTEDGVKEGDDCDNLDKSEISGITTTKKKKKLKKNMNDNTEQKVKKKHQKRPHSCEYCNQKFLHLNMLEVHKKCHEGEELIFKCQFCLEEAIDSTALKEHEATHEGPKPYLCTICGKTYKKRETMIYHRKHHQGEREYICDICSKRFNAACKLAKHIATHRSEQYVLRYECPVCAHMFNTKYHVQMHLATHQREGLLLESNRNEVLAMVLQNALKIPKQPDAAANLTDITPSDERYRICKICGETFHHFYYLEEHLKSHGSKIAIDDTNKSEEKKYICEICNKGFKLHYYLKLHSFTHTKEKPFICQQCGKGFITKGKLKRHLETHSGLKKYQCHICYKFFTRPSYLRIHIRTIHGTHYNFRPDKIINLGAMSAMTHFSDSQTSV